MSDPREVRVTPHDKVILQVQWAIQEAWKIAVNTAGITSWSEEKPGRKYEVEMLQMQIAKMILDDLRAELKG